LKRKKEDYGSREKGIYISIPSLSFNGFFRPWAYWKMKRRGKYKDIMDIDRGNHFMCAV
jgi:hypothetical protein